MNRGRIQAPLSASALDTGVVIVSVLSMEYLVLASGYVVGPVVGQVLRTASVAVDCDWIARRGRVPRKVQI